MRSNRLTIELACLLAFFGAFGQVNWALGGPTFFLGPGLAPNLDQQWQSFFPIFSEQDFETGFSNGDEVNSFAIGGVTVDVSVPNTSETAEIFAGGFAAGGGQAGTVSGNALFVGVQSIGLGRAFRFTFSTPVTGFGLWIFDDGGNTADFFTMTVNGVTSSALDGNPGSRAHRVEGFIGVIDGAGINEVIIQSAAPIPNSAFEVDHLQLSTSTPIPEPSTFALLGIGAIGMLGFLRKRRNIS